MDYLEDNRLKCKAILLTHGHYDHTGAVAAIAEETGAPVWMNRRDTRKPTENDPYRYAPPEGGNFYDDGDCVDVDAAHFQVIATPGTHARRREPCLRRSAFHRRHAVQRLLRPRRSPRRRAKDEMQSLRRLCASPATMRSTPAIWIPPRLSASAASTITAARRQNNAPRREYYTQRCFLMEPTLVILAAGMGSRFGGLKRITAVDEMGHAIIDYSMFGRIPCRFPQGVLHHQA